MITQELVKKLFNYSDGKLYAAYPRKKYQIGDEVKGTPTHKGRLRIKIGYTAYYKHRVIFLWHHGYLPEFVDHLDVNHLNNRIDNLRECTPLQNSYNRKKYPGKTSKYKGVCFFRDKWMAQIKHSGIRIRLGMFKSEKAAALTYLKASKEYHGDFSNVSPLKAA